MSCGQFKSSFCAVITRHAIPPAASASVSSIPSSRATAAAICCPLEGDLASECVRSLFRIMPAPSPSKENRANLHSLDACDRCTGMCAQCHLYRLQTTYDGSMGRENRQRGSKSCNVYCGLRRTEFTLHVLPFCGRDVNRSGLTRLNGIGVVRPCLRIRKGAWTIRLGAADEATAV